MDVSVLMAEKLVWLCLAAGLAGLVAWARPASRLLSRTGDALGAACLALSLAVWGLRWWTAGHLPLFGTFESSLSLTVAVLLAGACFRPRIPERVAVWPVATGIAAALLAHGLRYDPEAYALTISERSWVVDVHALVAWAAFGAFALNAGLAVQRLFGRGDPAVVDRWLARTLTVGFALHSAMLASGSFYKFLLFGRSWSFDPIETLGLVAWVAYGGLLHMHLFAGWEGRRLAAWSFALFVILVVSYRGIVYFPSWSTYHIFDMDLRMHLDGAGTPAPGGGP